MFGFAVLGPIWRSTVYVNASGRPLDDELPRCPRCGTTNTALHPKEQQEARGVERFCLDCKLDFTP